MCETEERKARKTCLVVVVVVAGLRGSKAGGSGKTRRETRIQSSPRMRPHSRSSCSCSSTCLIQPEDAARKESASRVVVTLMQLPDEVARKQEREDSSSVRWDTVGCRNACLLVAVFVPSTLRVCPCLAFCVPLNRVSPPLHFRQSSQHQHHRRSDTWLLFRQEKADATEATATAAAAAAAACACLRDV